MTEDWQQPGWRTDPPDHDEDVWVHSLSLGVLRGYRLDGEWYHEGDETEPLDDVLAWMPIAGTPQPDATVACKLCGTEAPARSAHLHQGGWVGPCCWDERLRTTE